MVVRRLEKERGCAYICVDLDGVAAV
jgi:hypothetical protein